MSMGKGIRGLAILVVLGSVAAANAQSVEMWFNLAGSAATDKVGDIHAPASPTDATTVTLSVYMQTTGVGNFTSFTTMFGYDTTMTQGFSAVPSGNGLTLPFSGNANDATVPGVVYNPSYEPFAFNQMGGAYGTGARPYGFSAVVLRPSGSFASADSGPVKLFDITLNVAAMPPSIIPITLWSTPAGEGPLDSFSSTVSPLGAMSPLNAPNFTRNLMVPEPASMIALGLGAAAMLRRRRK